tara:strand:- start:1204 stop:1455 length:252 start_codon:yes stop_codon:yes gene_type:complete
MFYEKWFDKGDLIMYEPQYNYALYDDNGQPYTMQSPGEKEIGVFLEYAQLDRFDSCRIYIVSIGKDLVVPQYQLKLLSKNKES